MSLPVLVPYVRPHLREEAVWAILAQEPDADFVELDAADPYAYSRLIIERWLQRTGLLIVEHDVIPPAGGLAELEVCPEEWCTFWHQCAGIPVNDTFGCVKLAQGLTERLYFLADQALRRVRLHKVQYATWQATAGNMAYRLRQAGLSPHVHDRSTVHLHDYGPVVPATPHPWPSAR